MLHVKTTAQQKRAVLRKQLESGKPVFYPGAYSPIVTLIIEKLGFDGVYISGGVMSNDLGLPDIALTTSNEVADRAKQISRATNLPVLVDADTGFGNAMNTARTIQLFEEAGVSGCHIEDQSHPKRCGHLDNKELISTEEMCQKIKAACDARKDKNFVIVARTDAKGVKGMEDAVARANAYVESGADVIFPEALHSKEEFKEFRSKVKGPLLGNMTEFGKSPLLTAKELEELKYNIVIYPVTTQRLALKAVEDGLAEIKKQGCQSHILDSMQTRKDLYELLGYEDYNKYDQDVYNFTLGKKK